MSVYSYKARDMNGLLVMGQMDGDGKESVISMLNDQGLIPVSVAEGANKLAEGMSLDFLKSVSGEELMLFTRQFFTLFKAGMDMETLLNTLMTQTKNKYFAETIERVKSDVAAGSSLSRAFAQHPKVFSELYVNMLATGEEAGILDEVLGHLCSVLEKEITINSSVKSATLYPKIVIFVLVCATIVIMTYVVPKFASFYAHYKSDLPMATKILMGSSDLVRNYWYLCLMTVGGLKFIFNKWVSTTKGRAIFDRFKWRLPVFGALGQKIANARFSHIVGSLYRAGIPITRGLEIAARTIGNEAYAHEVMIVKHEVEKGRGIAESMREREYFSPLLVESTAIGEKSGSLDDMYHSVGTHYDSEIAHTLKNLTTLIEPILLFVVFGMVTVFALGIFMPMLNISKAVMHH